VTCSHGNKKFKKFAFHEGGIEHKNLALIAAKWTSRISSFCTKLPLKLKQCYLLQKCWIPHMGSWEILKKGTCIDIFFIFPFIENN